MKGKTSKILADKKYRINGIEGDNLDSVAEHLLDGNNCNNLIEIFVAIFRKINYRSIKLRNDIEILADVFEASGINNFTNEGYRSFLSELRRLSKS